jgi:hypothetical protein
MFELTETTTQWRQQGMVLFPPPYQIAEESLQSLQNRIGVDKEVIQKI